MEEPEFKEFITQMYLFFHKKACRDSVFSTFETAERIFSFIDTKGLKNFCLVDKRGRSNVLGITDYIWKVLIEAKDFPLMGAKAKKIQARKRYSQTSSLLKLEVLSKRLGGVIENQSIINRNNLKEIELKQQRDHATKAMWGILRPQLEQLGIEFLPGLDDTARDIRMFLKNCSRLREITELNLSNLQIRLAPAELLLFTGLKNLDLSHNQLKSCRDPKRVREIKQS